ncbi:MAG: hypothetical protein ACR2ND_10485 [Solirubrobacteraceae bacterium]
MRALLMLTLSAAAIGWLAPAAGAAVARPGAAGALQGAGASPVTPGGNSLEAAAAKAGDTGRKVAFSLIGLAFSIAAIVMSFKRDFKDAVAVFAIGIVAVLLVSPAGIGVLQDTVKVLFG